MMAASNSCFVVSDTVNYVHGSLPFLTSLGGEVATRNFSLATVLISSPDYLGSLFDLYVRSLSWGFLIILLFVVVVLITSLLLICVYFCCFKAAGHEQPLPTDNIISEQCCLRWSFGAFSIACAMCSVVILAMGFWIESTLNKVLLSHALSSSVMNETIRHWIVMSVLIVATLILLSTGIAFLILLACKWSKCFTATLVSLSVVIALIAPLAGVGVSLLSFTSAFCEEFAGSNDCTSPVAIAWLDICTKGFQDAFTLLALSFGLVVFTSLGQCSGAVFSQLFLSHSKASTRVDSLAGNWDQPHEVLTPTSTTAPHLPTAPPAVAPAGAFVGRSHHNGDQLTNTNTPRRRQTMPAHTDYPSEQPPVYDDLWLSQSLRLTGTQESPSRNPGTVAENSPMDTSLGPGTDTVPARTGDNQTEYDTPL